MDERSELRRRYDDREMALIIKLASELEKREASGEDHSLGEIQEIAAQAGIDPDLILQAARALEAERSNRASSLVGAPTLFHFQRSVAGELPDGELGSLVRVIRQLTGREGEVAHVLDSLEWRDLDPLGTTTHVEITPREGRTAIRITARSGNAASLSYVGAGIIAAILSVIAGKELQAPVLLEAGVILGLWGTCYLGARTVWRRLAAQLESRFRRLTDTLAAQVTEALPGGSDSVIGSEPESWQNPVEPKAD
ncbi:MAG: hypothetical protein PVI01_13705 [Gemmatimonadales bacterium]|jgi:hypothetical protein